MAGCRKPPAPPLSPAAVATGWWHAVASGDTRSAAPHLYGDSARSKSDRLLAEYALVVKEAGDGDRLAAGMAELLRGVRIGEVRSGPEMAIVPLVLRDGRPFLDVRLELRNNRWTIVDIKDGVRL